MSNDAAMTVLVHDIANAINHDRHNFPVKWPHNFKVIEPDPGSRLVVQEGEGQELVEVKSSHVTNAVVRYMRMQLDPDLLLTARKAKEVVETWMAFADPIPMAQIANVRWKSDPGYTWRRLPWDRAEGATPTWDKILTKMSNAGAFRQWLGSLFHEGARQHQYVWIHGQGNDGKGSMNDILARVFHKAYRSKQPPHPGDKFWTYGLVGSRLVVFPDCNSQTFITGGLFKSLSGGDPVDVEAKGKMSFTARLGCKFLFLSNEKPNISCEDADMRRIIYCEFMSKMRAEDKDPLFKDKLWNEAGMFLSKCLSEYEKACPNHEDIENDKHSIEEWISVTDEKFQVFFDKYFMQPNELYRQSAGLSGLTDEQFDHVTMRPEDMMAFVNGAFSERKEQAQFRDWLYKKYGVQKRTIRRGETVVHRYVGVHRQPTTVAAKKLGEDLRKMAIGLKVVATPATVDTLT